MDDIFMLLACDTFSYVLSAKFFHCRLEVHRSRYLRRNSPHTRMISAYSFMYILINVGGLTGGNTS